MLSTADWPTLHSGTDADDGKPARLAMARAGISRWWISWDTMKTRNVAMGMIGLVIVLSAALGLTAMLVSDINERAYDIAIKVVLGYGGISALLMAWMRLDTISGKVDDAKNEAANTKQEATIARQEAARAAEITAEVHHDIRNDVLKNKVRQALAEERHMLANREAAQPMREQLEARGMPKRDTAD